MTQVGSKKQAYAHNKKFIIALALTLLRTRHHTLAARIYRTCGINHSQELVYIDQNPIYSKKSGVKSLKR